MRFLSSSPGKVEELESRKEGAIGEVAEFVSYLRQARQEAEEVVEEVDEARNRLDTVEEDAKSVIGFVEQLPTFKTKGGD